MTMTASALASEPTVNTAKKRIGIEDLLAWAYKWELPKAHAGANGRIVSRADALSGWGAIERYSELLTLVDISPNHFGCIPDFWGDVDATPHPDALLVAEAMGDLAETTMDWEDDVDVLSDVTMLRDTERLDCNQRGYDIARARGQQLAALVMRRAMIGGTPDWTDHGPVERRPVLTAKGGEAWFRTVMRSEGEGRPEMAVVVDGFDPTTRRPFVGAYRQSYLDPDPSLLAADRLDYQAWVSGLRFLAAYLTVARLEAHDVLPPTRPMWPWEGERADERRARILLAPMTKPVPTETKKKMRGRL